MAMMQPQDIQPLSIDQLPADNCDSMLPPSLHILAGGDRARAWVQSRRGQQPLFSCVLGFTETGLIPGISAAGATPADRRYTALADAEFLVNGPRGNPAYPLPPLAGGASPVLISRAILESLHWRLRVINAGLQDLPSIPHIRMGGLPARCLSTGYALDRAVVEQLFAAGYRLGQQLATEGNPLPPDYLLISECVVGGTSTALAVLLGLGIDATNRVNSSHIFCNHAQKLDLALTGLRRSGLGEWHPDRQCVQGSLDQDPLAVVAAVGDPMQPVAAGMALAASQISGVLLAGGTQMLAVYALARAIAQRRQLPWKPEAIAVGTTRWVAYDASGDTLGLAKAIAPPEEEPILLTTLLNFAQSTWTQLRAYEAGFVKEGVGAGGAAIAASCAAGWDSERCLQAIEGLLSRWSTVLHNP